MLRVGAGRRTILNRGMADMAFVAGLGPAAWFQYGKGITVATGVSQWNDVTANARHLKQGTGSAQPTLQADNSILFDGSAQFLKCDAFTLNAPVTGYFLLQQVSWTSTDVLFDGNSAGTYRTIQSGVSPQIVARQSVTLGPFSPDLAVGTYGVIAYVSNGASSSIQLNNNAASVGDTGAGNPGGFTLGATATPGNYANIQVKEVILFAAAHDAATRARVIRYLSIVGGVPL